MCHRVPGVPKRTHLSWATQSSYITYSKLHMLALSSSVPSVQYLAISRTFTVALCGSPKRFSFISRPAGWHHIQFNAAHFILPYLDPRTIHWFSFLLESASHFSFFDIQGFWTLKYIIQRCTHFIFLLQPKNKQIHSCQGLLTRNCSSVSKSHE